MILGRATVLQVMTETFLVLPCPHPDLLGPLHSGAPTATWISTTFEDPSPAAEEEGLQGLEGQEIVPDREEAFQWDIHLSDLEEARPLVAIAEKERVLSIKILVPFIAGAEEEMKDHRVCRLQAFELVVALALVEVTILNHTFGNNTAVIEIFVTPYHNRAAEPVAVTGLLPLGALVTFGTKVLYTHRENSVVETPSTFEVEVVLPVAESPHFERKPLAIETFGLAIGESLLTETFELAEERPQRVGAILTFQGDNLETEGHVIFARTDLLIEIFALVMELFIEIHPLVADQLCRSEKLRLEVEHLHTGTFLLERGLH